MISSEGGFEFAKRFGSSRGQNLSSVSVRSLLMSRVTRGLLGIADRYQISNFAILARLGGHGYKSLGRLYHKRSRKLERLWIGFVRPRTDSPRIFELWLGRDNLISPYFKGILVEFLRKALRPRELRLPPEELTFDLEILERTLIRSWVNQWYHSVAMSPEVNLQDILRSSLLSKLGNRLYPPQPILARTCQQPILTPFPGTANQN